MLFSTHFECFQTLIDYALAFVGGVMMAVAVMELIPEAVCYIYVYMYVLRISVRMAVAVTELITEVVCCASE